MHAHVAYVAYTHIHACRLIHRVTPTRPPAGEVRDQVRCVVEHTSSRGLMGTAFPLTAGGCEFEFRVDCILRLASTLRDMVTPGVARIDGASCRRWHRGQPHGHRGHVPLAARTTEK